MDIGPFPFCSDLILLPFISSFCCFSLQAAIGCRVAQVVMQYCILANHYWFLVEAVYLYKLLIGAVFSEKNYYTLYLYLGWGKKTSAGGGRHVLLHMAIT